MPLETKAERLTRSKKKRKRPSVSANNSKGKQAPGRKRTRHKNICPIIALRKQAMNKIKRAAEIGNMKGAQQEFLTWCREITAIVLPEDWTDLIEGELELTRSEIGHLLGRKQ